MKPPREVNPADFAGYMSSAMTKEGRTAAVLANKCSVSEAVIREWVAGVSMPDRKQWGLLGLQLRIMKTVRPTEWGWTRAPRKAPPPPAPNQTTLVSKERRAFGAALREVVAEDQQTPEDVACVLDVEPSVVRAWMDGTEAPDSERYKHLLVVYEELRLAAPPDPALAHKPAQGMTLISHNAAQGPESIHEETKSITPAATAPPWTPPTRGEYDRMSKREKRAIDVSLRERGVSLREDPPPPGRGEEQAPQTLPLGRLPDPPAPPEDQAKRLLAAYNRLFPGSKPFNYAGVLTAGGEMQWVLRDGNGMPTREVPPGPLTAAILHWQAPLKAEVERRRRADEEETTRRRQALEQDAAARQAELDALGADLGM